MTKRIKHNDLLPWFTDDHGTLPAAYLASCEKFFKRIKKTPAAFWRCNLSLSTLCPQQQAPSTKPQASSNKRLTAAGPYDINRIIKEK